MSKKSKEVDEKAKRDEFLVEIGERVRRARDAATLTQLVAGFSDWSNLSLYL